MTARCLWPILILATLGACEGNGTIGIIAKPTVDVRVVNASTINIDLLQDQAVPDGDLAFGAGSQCLTVDIVSHGLSVRPAGVRTATTPLPSFAANEGYVVLITGSASALQPVSFRNSFTAAAGKAGIRFVNVSGAGSYDIHVTAPAAPLSAANAANVVTGTASSFFNVPITTQQVRLTLNASSIVAFDVGNVTLASGARAVVVLAPPATGGMSPRPFVFQIANGASC